MKHPFGRLACVIAFVCAATAVAGLLIEPTRAERWEKVNAAVQKGLPKTALKELDPILASALKDKDYPEAIKAVCRKIDLEGQIAGGKAEERIARLRAALPGLPAEMHPVLHVVLGHWYAKYLLASGNRTARRSAAGKTTGNDVTTWDNPRILAEIGQQFEIALSHEKDLKAIPVARYDSVLSTGTIPDSYRPTLFDILAFDALDYYAFINNNIGARPEDDFEIPVSSPILASVDEFVKWQPKTTDAGSRLLKSIRLYQKLLAFHQSDADRTALLDADLARLEFGSRESVGENAAAAYKAALARFAKENKSHELSALARSRWAAQLQEEDRLAEAREVALVGFKDYPKSQGGISCFESVRQIEEKSAQLGISDRIWGESGGEIRIVYKNVTKVYFRVIPIEFKTLFNEIGWYDQAHEVSEILGWEKKLLKEKPVAAFSHDLPPTHDFQLHTESIPTPKNISPGHYVLLVSYRPDFAAVDNERQGLVFWRSNLTVAARHTPFRNRTEGIVTWGDHGEPVANAKAEIFRWNRTASKWKLKQTTRTNQSGQFAFEPLPPSNDNDEWAWWVAISHNDHTIGYQPSVVEESDNSPAATTTFFTDRSLYRPGQTVRFKGISHISHAPWSIYKAMQDHKVEVQLLDANGVQVTRQTCQTNTYGSFSGSFALPSNRATGRWTIRVARGPQGGVAFFVEEYKRPTFTVSLDAPREAVRLGARVRLTGRAMAFSGAPLSFAKVEYQVHKFAEDFEPNMRHIAHKTTTTDAAGNFIVEFIARPNDSIPAEKEPIFQFSVGADVTDSTGETRTARTKVKVAFTAIAAKAAIDPWQTVEKPVAIRLSTRSHDGVPQATKGTLRIYQLRQPNQVGRPSIIDCWQHQLTEQLAARNPDEQLPEPLLPEAYHYRDPVWPERWHSGELVNTTEITTDFQGKAEANVKLPVGAYRVEFEAIDPFGRKTTARTEALVLDLAAVHLAIKTPVFFAAPSWSVEPGKEFVFFWGTGHDRGRVFIEVERRGKILHAGWTDPNRTQGILRFPVAEEHRGGFTIRALFFHDNRAHFLNRRVDVPWTNKKLTLRWETFRSKLEPGQKEKFGLVITGPDAHRAAAEMVATLYDKSLDAFLPHQWEHSIGSFAREESLTRTEFSNSLGFVSRLSDGWDMDQPLDRRPFFYRGFASFMSGGSMIRSQTIPHGVMGGGLFGMMGGGMLGGGGGFGAGQLRGNAFNMNGGIIGIGGAGLMGGGMIGGGLGFGGAGLGFGGASGPQFNPNPVVPPNLDNVSARKNLNETAFFFPHLVSDADGVVRMEFTMPEALTKWKFLGFAHDKELRSGYLTDEIVTAKELMAQPNPPRFLRDGDVIEFPVKVSNQSATRQKGKVKLSFKDARTEQPVDAALGIAQAEQEFDIPAGESKTFAWKLAVPDGTGPLTFKAVAASERLSDGEEGVLPVLAKKVLVTESIALPIRGPGTKEFDFVKLRDSAGSTTIRNQSFTVQMVSQPAWYAVMALPYLMEYPHECTEQTFNRLYANGLARHIGNSDPKIRRIFNLWKGTAALDSPLEKNQDLKAVLLDETPWVRQAVKEGQARKNIGILFDENRLNDETARLTKKLADMQLGDGTWPWFPGGPSNRFITLYIATGYGRLRHLGVKIDAAPGIRATAALDAWADEMYRHILRFSKNPSDNHLSSLTALYIYCRSFYLQDRAVANEHRQAVEYWLSQAKKYWLQLANRQSQAHIAVGLKRFGDKQTPGAIMASIKERSVSNEEMGMFWRDLELQQFWFRAPIETQAMMIEAFDEVSNDQKSVEDCKVWLLKQKQTQDWKTTKATADAIYALLLRGDNLLKSDALVEMTVGNTKIVPEKIEAGTGFYEQRFLRTEIQPSMSAITLKKTDPGVSWGSATWQYLEDLDKVSRHDAGPLKVEKRLFKKSFTKAGPKIDPFENTPLSIGDEMVVRVVIRTDRDMEYVHLRDHRGSGTEPVNVLSKYRFQDGLAYYESTKDTATHFFIDYLPKGNYVFEYSVRVQHRGKYPTGYAHLECMYAPEFNSHSENINLEVK